MYANRMGGGYRMVMIIVFIEISSTKEGAKSS